MLRRSRLALDGSTIEMHLDDHCLVDSFTITGQPSEAQLLDAQVIVQEYLAPIEPRILVKALTELDALTVKRAEAQGQTDLTIAAYADRLAIYPEDIVIHVLTSWPSRSKWWPSWYELNLDIEWRVTKRRLLLDAITDQLVIK